MNNPTSKLKIVDVVRRLRGKNGCPWNASQTPQQLFIALKDEVHELGKALQSGAIWQIEEELGDILFNLTAIIEAYNEKSLFDLESVDLLSSTKFKARHPYVFGEAKDPGPELAEIQWKNAKAQEEETRLQNRVGVIFGYTIFDVGNQELTTTHWLKDSAADIAETLGIIEPNSIWNYSEVASNTDNFSFVLSGQTPGFLVLQMLLVPKLVLIQGFSMHNIKPFVVYKKLVTLFQNENITSQLISIDHKSLDSF